MSAIQPFPPSPPPTPPALLSTSLHSFDADPEEKGDLKLTSDRASSDLETQSVTSTLAERRFLRRLDVCLLTWAWCSYIIKLMDTSNYKTAFASGMKEDMGLYGNELNYMDTTFRVGYALFLIPSQLLLLKIKPSLFLPSLECGWGILTLLMAFVPSHKGMYALRFFIGVLEASSYPGILSILCSWYTPAELATRITIFSTSYPAANMFVSFLQAALAKMDGTAGLAGWRWLFVFNGLMTMVVAVSGYFLLPDNPGETKVFWLTPAQNALSRVRMTRVKKLAPTKLTLAKLKKTFTSWPLYLFTFAYVGWSFSQDANSYTILFIKSLKNAEGKPRFGISERNAIMLPGHFLQIVTMLICGWASGKYGSRLKWILGQLASILFCQIVLAVWPASTGFKFFAFYGMWCSNAVGPILIAWMADICPSPEERSVLIGVAVTFNFAVNAFQNVLIWPTVQAPRYQSAGFKVAACYSVLSMVVSVGWWYMDRKTRASREVERDLACEEEREREAAKVEEKKAAQS